MTTGAGDRPAPPLLFDGPLASRDLVVLAHGAGAAMDSPFMTTIAQGLAAADIRVARFEFPYMRAQRAGGPKRPPNRDPVLLDCWRAVVHSAGGGDKVVIGGKSLGGRIASVIADEVGARGVLCLGYPFHAPGRPEKTRLDHLPGMRTPTLIVQGTRDALGRREEVAGYALSAAIAWIDDGDHSFNPRRASGRSLEQNLAAAVAAATSFVKQLS